MPGARHILLKDITGLLDGEEYVALKYILDELNDLAPESDLDLLVTKALIEKIQTFCQQHLLVVKVIHEKVFERTTLRIYLADGGFIKLDLLEHLVWKRFIYLPTESLFQFSHLHNGMPCCHPLHLFEHVVLYYFLNGSPIPNKYILYFQKLPQEVSINLLPYFNQKYHTSLSSIADLAEFSSTTQKSIQSAIKQLDENQGMAYWKRFVSAGWAQLKRRIPKMGRIVTFTGVDGVGKTTLLDKMEQTLIRHHGEKVIRLRHRPGILPIISAWRYGKAAAEKRSVSCLPRQGTNKSQWQSLLRFAYYYSDYLIGQYWVKARYCLLGYTVLYDRYYFDFIVDGKRSNIQLNSSCPLWLYRYLLKPQLNFFFFADPATILARKQELSEEEIVSLTQAYTQLFCKLKEKAVHTYHLIKNENKDMSIRQVLQWYNHQIS